MTVLRFCFIAALLACAGGARALEPEYTGQFGYPEEPALRPYKWFWVGAKALGYQTKMGFVRGNMNFPVLGTVETARGIRKGAVDMGEFAWNGILYRSVPPKGFHKTQGNANDYIDSDLLMRNAADLLSNAIVWQWYFWPVQKVVDLAPLENDAKVDIRLEEAARVREDRRTAEMVREEQRKFTDETPVEKAQRAYLDDRAHYGSAKSVQKQIKKKKEQHYTGNLLKVKAVKKNR